MTAKIHPDDRSQKIEQALTPLWRRVQAEYQRSIKEKFFAPKFIVLSSEDYKTIVDAYGYEPKKFMGLTIVYDTTLFRT